MTSVQDQQQGSGKRDRSTIGFPYGDLEQAIKVARALHQQGGGRGQQDQLAAWLGHTSIGGGAFRQQLSTARTFGVSESAQGSVVLTPLGHRIVDPAQEARARVDAFLNVPLYQAVYERFRGHTLPSGSGLENVFADLGVAEKQTEKARHAFQRSAQQAGFFNAGADRLVEPSTDRGQQSLGTNGSQDGDARDESPAAPSGDPRRDPLHPLIQGLVATLPEPGSAWSDEEREEWLNAAKSNFALIYKRDLKQLPPGEPNPVEQATA